MADLHRCINGGVHTHERQLALYAQDFSHTERKMPLAVVEATCEEDIANALRVAQAHDLPVSVRGSGHSMDGQMLNRGGIVILLKQLEARVELLANDLAHVSASTTWIELEKTLNRIGRSAPVLTDYLGLTVGGTLSVGGYGLRSVKSGAQVDHIERLRLVRPDGTALWCSKAVESDLFFNALAGLGNVGVISSVVMRTIPYKKYATEYTFEYDDKSKFLKSFEWIQDPNHRPPDQFTATFSPGRYKSFIGMETASKRDVIFAPPPKEMKLDKPNHVITVADCAVRLHQYNQRFERNPTAVNLFADYFFDYDGFVSFFGFLEAYLRANSGILDYVQRANILLIRTMSESASMPFRISSSLTRDNHMLFGIGVYTTTPCNAKSGIEQNKRLFSSALDACVRYGGYPYLYGYHRLSEALKLDLYGDDYACLKSLAREADPRGLFNPHTF